MGEEEGEGEVDELNSLLSSKFQNNYSTLIGDGNQSYSEISESEETLKPKSILSPKREKSRLPREVSWTDLSGLPLEKVYEVPGTVESELRGSMTRYNFHHSEKPKFAPLLVLLLFFVILLAVIIFFAIYF